MTDSPPTTDPLSPRTPPKPTRTVVRFVVLFAVSIGVYYLLSGTAPFRERFFPWYLVVNAHGSSTILSLLGQATQVSDNMVYSRRFSVDVQRGCDAVEPTALYVAAVIASPVVWRLKTAGILIGSAILALLNLLRVVTLFLIGVYWPAAFHVMHVDIWQAIFIFLALLFWVLWAMWAVNRMSRASP